MQTLQIDQAGLDPKDAVFSATKLVAALNVLNETGIDTAHVFEGTGLSRAQLSDPNTKISPFQHIKAFRNICDATDDADLPFRIGQSVHISAYGLFGYAILCSKDYATAAAFARKYHSLAGPLIEIDFVRNADQSGWQIVLIPHALIDDDFGAFLLNLHIGIFLTLHKDIFGPRFQPRFIKVTYPDSSRFRLPEGAAARISYGAKQNLWNIPARHIDTPLVLGNDHTFQQIEQICQAELGGMQKSAGLSGQVRSYMLRAPGRGLSPGSLEDIAAHFQMTSRTLRRHLRSEGTSLRGILDAVRSELAIKYLRENHLSNAEIAHVLGFSEPASFGRAFRRWTNRTPTEYRRAASPA